MMLLWRSPSKIMQRYGTSYYYATLFFPKDIQEEVMELYRFVRIPDEIVDHITSLDLNLHYTQAKIKLQDMHNDVLQAIKENNQDHHTRWQTAKLFNTYHITHSYVTDFFQAMIQDCTVHRYETYIQLQWYMYGSAEVVWLMMCDILQSPKHAHAQARLLGEAMQYTNFLRDIYEDYVQYWRIYMPDDRLKVYELTHNDIIHFCQTNTINKSFKKFMQAQIKHCRDMYIQANKGITLLPEQAQLPVLLASKLYEGILDKIVSIDYNVFANSARTNKRQKVKIVWHQVIKHYHDRCRLRQYYR